jgi:hypothetical protein
MSSYNKDLFAEKVFADNVYSQGEITGTSLNVGTVEATKDPAKLGFFGLNPLVDKQPGGAAVTNGTGGTAASQYVTSTAVNPTKTEFDNNFSTAFTQIKALRDALIAYGLVKDSAV